MYKLVYANKADEDLQSIFDYIAQDNIETARKYLCKLEKQILRLVDFPNIGSESKYPELIALGIRVLPFDDYLIFYTINSKAEVINIIRVLHGSVNYKRLFIGK